MTYLGYAPPSEDESRNRRVRPPMPYREYVDQMASWSARTADLYVMFPGQDVVAVPKSRRHVAKHRAQSRRTR